MRILRFRAGLLVGLLTLASASCKSLLPPKPPMAPVEFNFATSALDRLPEGFSTALTGGGGPVEWVIRKDPTAPGGGPVLVQESADNTSYRFPLCIYDAVVARDVAAETTFKPISGKVDEAGGIVLRYTPGNYYIARANALENNVILFKVVAGKRSKVEEVPVPVSAGQWHTLRFQAKGHYFEITFDGKLVLERNDRTFSNPGKVGLWTKADSVSAFSDLKIESAR